MKKIKKILGFLALLVVLVSAVAGCGAPEQVVQVADSPEVGQIQIVADQPEQSRVQSEEQSQIPPEEKSAEQVQTESEQKRNDTDEQSQISPSTIDESGTYTSKDDVALYIHTYAHLPSNYITKKEAQAAGWKDKGTLDKVCPGKSIGGDKYGNYEGLLPDAGGRKYFECDIDYVKGNRNAKRIIYSNDGLIYYTDDHYASFTQLY